MPQEQKLGIEEKVRIVRQCLAGEMGISEASRKAGVDHAAVRQWIARYEAEGADAFLPYERNRNYSQELKSRQSESIWPAEVVFYQSAKNTVCEIHICYATG